MQENDNAMTVLGISTSLRENSHSETLLRELLRGAKSEVPIIRLREHTVLACTGCGKCKDTFQCVLADDFMELLNLVKGASKVAIAGGVYFRGMNSTGKSFVDRCQCEWARGGDSFVFDTSKKMVLVATCGSTHLESFTGIRTTVKSVARVLGFSCTAEVCCFNTDNVIPEENPKALSDAYNIGVELRA